MKETILSIALLAAGFGVGAIAGHFEGQASIYALILNAQSAALPVVAMRGAK